MRRMTEMELTAAEAAAEAARPKTLRELGVPGALALEMEAIFRVRGERGLVSGYRFVTPDGVSHSIRLG